MIRSAMYDEDGLCLYHHEPPFGRSVSARKVHGRWILCELSLPELVQPDIETEPSRFISKQTYELISGHLGPSQRVR